MKELMMGHEHIEYFTKKVEGSTKQYPAWHTVRQ